MFSEQLCYLHPWTSLKRFQLLLLLHICCPLQFAALPTFFKWISVKLAFSACSSKQFSKVFPASEVLGAFLFHHLINMVAYCAIHTYICLNIARMYS
jgi:hypothetical protein